jgi:hypothetical protein
LAALNMKVRPLFYARFQTDRLWVRYVGTERAWEGEPVLAVDTRRGYVRGIGGDDANVAMADGPPTRLISCFRHEHPVVRDFHAAATLLRYVIYSLREPKRSWLDHLLFRKWNLILHPVGPTADNLDSFEAAGLKALGDLTGANETIVWTGAPLSDRDLAAGTYLRLGHRGRITSASS